MAVIVDTSVWIDYFRSGDYTDKLDQLLNENLVVINDLVLAELIPLLIVKNQKKIVNLLNKIDKITVKPDWAEIINYQAQCLQSGSSGIGIPDLLIAQNSIQHDLPIFTLDKHFRFMQQAKIGVKLYI